MILYHGSRDIVEYPEIRKAQYNKDFYFGFYCTNYPEQAKFKYPTHQISFHTISALDTLKFLGSEEVYGNKK